MVPCSDFFAGRHGRGDTGSAARGDTGGATRAREHFARRRPRRRSVPGGRGRTGRPARGKPRGAPAILVKVARTALIRGGKILKKILKNSLSVFELARRLTRVNRALSMLQREGPNFSPLYRGKTPPSRGGRPARGGDPRGPKMSKIQVYSQIDRPDSFFPLFSGIFGNDFSWEKITVFFR